VCWPLAVKLRLAGWTLGLNAEFNTTMQAASTTLRAFIDRCRVRHRGVYRRYAASGRKPNSVLHPLGVETVGADGS
jgi:hypothetical protein